MFLDIPNSRKRRFSRALLQWYNKGRRQFPWRNGKRNAYEILIAEMMLRKTDSAKAAEVYDKFVAKYPTPVSLANAKIASIRKEIKLLGIADRGRLLKLTARQIVENHHGNVPHDFSELIALPGVGPYTANAVLCFAFREDMALLDTNIIRVLGRVFSVHSNKPRARDDPALWDFAEALVPKGKAISYNRALLDFAAQVCTLANPKCSTCPLRGICDYARADAKDCKT